MNQFSIYLRSRKYENKKGVVKYGYFVDIYKKKKKGTGERRKEYLKGLFTSKDYATPIGYTKKGKPKFHSLEPDDFENWQEIKRQFKQRKESIKKTKNSLSYYENQNQSFIEYYEKNAEEKNNQAYMGSLFHLRKHTDGELAFKDVTSSFLETFYKYLLNKVHINTAHQYMRHLSIIWNIARYEELTDRDPFFKFYKKVDVKTIQPETNRLSIDQVRRLAENKGLTTPLVYKSFLFSCFTGLRYSDVRRLKWKQVDAAKAVIYLRQKKSQAKPLELPLHDDAIEILDTIEHEEGLIFPGLPETSSNVNVKLRQWAKDAGLKLNFSLSFHKARHSYATWFYQKTGDIYSTKDALGHSNISNTMRYAQTDLRHQRANVKKIERLGVSLS